MPDHDQLAHACLGLFHGWPTMHLFKDVVTSLYGHCFAATGPHKQHHPRIVVAHGLSAGDLILLQHASLLVLGGPPKGCKT